MIFFRQSRKGIGLATTRVEAFSDGVFAIAITILILGLAVPELSSTHTNKDLVASLILLWPKVLSYMISFAVIGIFWLGHHVMFHFIKRVDRNFVWLNTLFLMIIAFFPFPVSLIGEYSRDAVSVFTYGLTLIAAGLIFEAMWFYASNKRRLISPDIPERIIKLGKKVVFAAPAVYAIALVLYFVSPAVTLGIYILVPVLYIFPSPVDELIEFEQKK